MVTLSPSDQRMRSLARLAVLCVLLVLAITSLSAFIRLSRAGLGCEPWPQCWDHGAALAVSTAVAAARMAHRVFAVAALLVIIMLVMNTLAKAPVLRREGRLALGLLVLAVFLAVLGRWTGDAKMPAVVLGNLLGGFAMVALSWHLARRSLAAPRALGVDHALTPWVVLGMVLLLIQVALGGLVHALHVANAPDALAHLAHRIGALVLLCVLVPLGIAAWRHGRRAGAVLLALLVLQGALGLTLFTASLPLAVALAHNLVSALLLAVLPGLALGPQRNR